MGALSGAIAANGLLSCVPQTSPRIGRALALSGESPVALGGCFFRGTALVGDFETALLLSRLCGGLASRF